MGDGASDTNAELIEGTPPETGDGYRCMECSYPLDGLPAGTNCPECGTPVRASLSGMLLVHRSPRYLRALRSGLTLILVGIIAYGVLQVLSPLSGFLMSLLRIPVGGPWFVALNIGLSIMGLAVQVTILLGWWRFTTRDPGDTTPEGAPTARVVVRSAVITSAGSSLLGLVAAAIAIFAAFGGGAPTGQGTGAGLPPLLLTAIGLGGLTSVVGLAAFAVQFFGGMLYVRGMALRLPSEKIARLAKTRMIACPIWATVGILILVGPVVAAVLYWRLLYLVRRAIGRVLREQAGEADAETAADIVAGSAPFDA